MIEPPDANGTLKVDTSMIVTFRVTDYAGLQSTCQVGINLAGESDLKLVLYSKDYIIVSE